MVSSAIEGFVTGFTGTLAEGVRERNAEARDYFNKQVEYARGKGLENRQRVKQEVDAQIAVARQLEMANVPQDIIMSVAASGQDLGSFYKTVEELRAEEESKVGATPMTADRWREIIKVSEEFKAPDEDMASFLTRLRTPISSAMSDPSFEDDPRGTLLTRLLGFNNMDIARQRLATTEIADGMTAQDLIRYGDFSPQFDPNAGVSIDYTSLQREREINPRDREVYRNTAEEILREELQVANNGGPVPSGGDATTARQNVLDYLTRLYGPEALPDIQDIVDANLERMGYTFDGAIEEDATGGPESDVGGPLTPPGGGGSQTTTQPSTEAPTLAEVDPVIYENVANVYAPEVVLMTEEALKDPNLTESERRSLEIKRDTLLSAAKTGMGINDAFATALAALQDTGSRLVEYGVAVPLSVVSPEAASGVFDWVDRTNKLSDEIDAYFERPITTQPPLTVRTPEEGTMPVLTVPTNEGKTVKLVFVRDNGDGTSTWENPTETDPKKKAVNLNNQKVQELIK